MNLNRRHLFAVGAILPLILTASCSDHDPTGLPMGRGNSDPVVFADGYGDGVYFQAFSQTDIWSVSRDSVFAYGGQAQDGARSLKIRVAPDGAALGLYAGGVLTTGTPRDLADYNALTFYARADQNVTMNELGFGNDNTGTSLFSAGRANVALGAGWKFVVVPVPNPAKLLSERGMFTFAEGREAQFPAGYNLWFDEIRFARLGNVTDPRPTMPSSSKQYFIGSVVNLSGTSTVFDVDGAPVTVNHMPGYFDFRSSNPAVAQVTRRGVEVVGVGDATVTALLGDVAVDGEVIVSGFQPPTGPAPSPIHPANQVISLFSDAYNDVPVDSWNPHWQYSTTQDELYAVDGNPTRMYSTLNFVGIVFSDPMVDASAMTHFHLDVYAPVGTEFRVKFVTFSDTGLFRGQTELEFDATTTPAFTSGGWSSLDIPLDDFAFQPPVADPWAHLGQLVLSTDSAQLVLVDNLYWHQ